MFASCCTSFGGKGKASRLAAFFTVRSRQELEHVQVLKLSALFITRLDVVPVVVRAVNQSL